MKHRSANPKSLNRAAPAGYLTALLIVGAWADSSHADAADAADTTATTANKKSGSDELQEVLVGGYRITRGSVGSLVDAPVQDIPRNIVAVTEEILTNQMVGNAVDILRNFPGVQRGSEAPGEEHPRVRGMIAFQFLDGTFSGGVIWDSAELIGAGELLTGPNSVQYGFQSGGGGVINYRIKRPAPSEYLDVTAQVNNWGDNKYVLDANMPLWGTAGDGVRAMAVHESISDFRRDAQEGKRNSAAIMLTKSDVLGIKSELDFEISRRDAAAAPTVSFSENPDGPLQIVNPRDSLIQPWEHLVRDGHRVGGKFSRDLIGTWSAVLTLSTESQSIINKSCSLFDPDADTGEGSYVCNTFGFEDYTNTSYRLDILGSFNTFGIHHDMTFGASHLRQHLQLPHTFDTFGDPLYTTNNLYTPRDYPEPFIPTSQQVFDQVRWTSWYTTEYIQDRMQFGEHWDLWAGVNYGVTRETDWDITGQTYDVKDHGVSPSFSLTFTPKDKLRFYVTYADAIAPGGSAPVDPEYTNSGEHFPALRLKSYEVGVKWQVARISQLNLNVFNEEQPLEFTKIISPTQFFFTREGKNRYTGVEFTSSSIFPFGLILNAGFTLLHPVQEKTGDPTLDGKYVNGVSRQSAAVYAEYRLPHIPDLGLTANVTYNSSAPLLPTNGYDTGSYTIADLGAFYNHPVGDIGLTYRVLLTNASDKHYYSPYNAGFVMGEPRTLMASVTARFAPHD